MKRLDIQLGHKVVCYDTQGGPGFFSYRAAWMLKAMGHPNVCVLNGGLPQWIKEGKPTESSSTSTNDNFGYKLDTSKIALYDEIKAFADSAADERDPQLYDARPPADFKEGNIPGSRTLPAGLLFDDSKALLSNEDLIKKLEESLTELTEDGRSGVHFN